MTEGIVYVGIDIAKVKNDVLVELPNGKHKKMRVTNTLHDFQRFARYLESFQNTILIGFEATSNYHRPIAYFLKKQGFDIFLISSLAAARTREALHNSWDKNDPKDAQVILYMLKAGITQVYYDAYLEGFNDIQELSKTHYQISLRKVKLQHSLLTHYLPLYFPEVQKYYHSSRAEWFSHILYHFPTPSVICKMSEEEFIAKAWDLVGRKVAKRRFLADFYKTASNSIGIPINEESQSMAMFRLIINEYKALCKQRAFLENEAERYLQHNHQYKILKSLPGVGPILALTIIAETGDFVRFNHYKQYLKYCGFDLSTYQSGQFRGQSKISKHGNARLRCAYWMAATIAVRMRENTLQKKYSRYIAKNEFNKDVKRKALTATAAKIARIAYSLIKNNQCYYPYYDEAIPSG